MIEFAELARQAADVLKPFLLASAGKLAQDALEAGGEQASNVYDWLKAKFTKPAASGALEEVSSDPEDDTNWEILVLQIRKALETDDSFREELLALLPDLANEGHTTQTQTAIGDHNIQIEQSGSGGTIQVNKPPG